MTILINVLTLASLCFVIFMFAVTVQTAYLDVRYKLGLKAHEKTGLPLTLCSDFKTVTSEDRQYVLFTGKFFCKGRLFKVTTNPVTGRLLIKSNYNEYTHQYSVTNEHISNYLSRSGNLVDWTTDEYIVAEEAMFSIASAYCDEKVYNHDEDYSFMIEG